MSQRSTRRDFLKSASLVVAAGAINPKIPNASAAVAEPAPAGGEITVRVTGGSLRHASVPALAWTKGKPGENSIVVSPGTKFQEILGFGGAFTDATCYTFNRLSAPVREQVFHALFHPSEIGLSVCRTCIGASDYSTEVFSYDEGEPDPEMKRFSIEHDRAYVLPMLRQARKVNPDLFLFSSPWSPPGWMKAGGSMLGGSFRPRNYAAYAQYFLKFLQGYAAEGVPVQAVTVQNEVDTDQDGRMPACSWPQEYEIEFVKEHLGPVLRKNGVSTRIWILDHNYNLWGRAISELDDPGLRKYCNEVAFHGYVGTPEMMSKVHEAHPDAQFYWTEGGSDYTQPDYGTDWAKWGEIFADALRNWCRSMTAWNLALDEKGRPNIGPFSCGGLVTIQSQTREITYSGQYWTFAHFSHAIRRGAHRVESTGQIPGIHHVAFENPDGQKVLVVSNTGQARKVSVQQGDHSVELAPAADSVMTLTWS